MTSFVTLSLNGRNVTNEPSQCPSRQNETRVHSDLWQLKIDMPGGHWDPKDLERDIRLERIGPWTMCFTCSTVSVDHQKCRFRSI